MARGLNRFFNIEKTEQSIVSILLLQSVFLGIFAGAFDVGAHSLFLSVYDARMIPGAFVISGLAGIILTSVYTRLQRIMPYSSFIILVFVFVASVTLLLRLAFKYTDSQELVYIVFVLMGPLTIISFLGFWGNVSRIFTLRQGKRLFGIIDTGQILGVILISYTIPVLMRLKFDISDTLLISAMSIFMALMIQLVISRKANFREIRVAGSGSKSIKRNGFFHLFKSGYTRLIMFFVGFSVVAAFFVHFSFISITQINYPEPENLASFLGAFMGTLMVFTVIVKTFLYGRLMKIYGLRLALLISPVLIGIFTLLLLISGSIYGFGAGTAGFTLVFLLLALSKLFIKTLKDSIEVPSSKVLYQSLEPDIRYDVQARIDGTVNEMSAFFSGLLLSGLGLIALINFLHYSLILVVILGLWLLTGILLYRAYRESLIQALRRYRESGEFVISRQNRPRYERHELKGDRLYYSLRLLPQLWNGFFSQQVKWLLKSPEKKISEEAFSLINVLGIPDEELVILQKEPEGRKTSDQVELSGDGIEVSGSEIQTLLQSCEPSARKSAIYMISRSGIKNMHTRLIPLFRDYDPTIRASAIRATGATGNPDIMHYLVDLLEDKQHYSNAFHALVKSGSNALDALEKAFFKSGASDKMLRRITKTMACIDSPQKKSYLLSKLEHPDMLVVNEALTGLAGSGFHPTGTDMSRLISQLRRIADIAAHNFALLVSLRAYLPEALVTAAMEEEYKENLDMIFSLLSLAYDPQAIYYIRQNYESGTAEGIGFAIELLGLFISEEIHPFLFPLFEDSPDSEKVKDLQVEYPVEIQKPPGLLFSILNSSLSHIGYYPRICALNEFMHHNDFKLTNDIIAQAFHPNQAIREAAIMIIRNIDPDILPDIQRRSVMELYEWNRIAGIEDVQGEINKIQMLAHTDAFASLRKKALPEFAHNFTLSYFPGFRNKKISEIFNEKVLIIIINGSILIRNLTDATIISKKDDIFLTSELMRVTGKESLVDSEEGIEFMWVLEDDLRELLFDWESESDLLINAIIKENDTSNKSLTGIE